MIWEESGYDIKIMNFRKGRNQQSKDKEKTYCCLGVPMLSRDEKHLW